MRTLLFNIVLLAIISQVANGQMMQTEQHRPRFHFTPPQNWINDPNGLVYVTGEYHLYYQHNPFGNEWGHMSWGHAVSKDLLTWTNLPVALAEFKTPNDTTQTMIFSGSAVVDRTNTSGFFGRGKADGMVALYTSHVHANGKGVAQHQSVAYSDDKGRTWKQFDKNPVLDLGMKDFRDPNVFWYAPQNKWVMAVVKPLDHTVQLYESPNLKNWTLMSEFGKTGDMSKIWECPALVEVPVAATGVAGSARKKWVLLVSSGHRQKDYLAMQYFVGDFDGKTFTAQKQNEVLYVDEGKDFYAGISFNNLPQSRTKPVMIGWVNDWAYAGKLPTEPFKGSMSVPRELSLRTTPDGYRLVQNPVSFAKLRGKKTTLTNVAVTRTVPLAFVGEHYELAAEITIGSAKKVGIRLLKSLGEESVLTYDATTQTLSFDRTKSGNVTFSDRFPSVESVKVQPQNGLLKLHLLVDGSVVEIFANDGQQVMTELVFPTKHEGRIELFSEGGTATVNVLNCWAIGGK